MQTRVYRELNFHDYPDYGMPREEWLEARRGGIGSSDVAPILGMDRFRSPMSVYLDKIGERGEDPDNAMMKWGRRLESAVAAEFSDEQDVQVQRPDAMYQHSEHDFALASPDRLVLKDWMPLDSFLDACVGVVEVKTGRNTHVWDDGPPAGYVLQTLHQMEVMGVEHGWIAALLNGHDYRSFEVKRDALLAENLMEAEAEFWQLVQSKNPPAVDGHEATVEALKRLHAVATPGREVDARPILDALARAKEAKQRLAVVQENVNEAENEIRAYLGDAEIGIVDDVVVVTWKQGGGSGRGRVDIKALEADHPAVVAEYRKPALTRTLLVK